MSNELLTNVCEIQYGFPFDSKQFSKENGTPLIRIRDIQRGYSDTYTTEPYKDEYLIHEGDLLIGMDGEFNIARWGKIPSLLNQRVCRLKPNEARCNKDYIFYCMPQILKKIEDKTSFVTVKHLSAKQLNAIEIPLPPLAEQQKIADTLDKVSHLIALRKEQLSKLDLLVKAKFVEMFGDPVENPMGWESVELSRYIQFLTSGSRGWAKYFSDSGEMFLTIKNVKNNKITTTNIQYVQAPDDKEAKRTKVQENDLLISITADLGRTGVVTPEIANFGAYINQHLSLIRLNTTDINPYFISFFLETKAGRNQFESKNQSAVKAGLNFEAIKSLQIIAPPLSLQTQFADYVTQVETSKKQIQQGLEKLEVLYRGLMQEYFE